ncbi:MAG: hypothetical protein M3Y27_23805 [Acidobacteriota bacterium]|nr:hypothetical protein [Acidobacteriota bacterium]
MGYSVYYTGEIAISPDLTEEHESLLAEALPSKTEALSISKEESGHTYYGCDWQLVDARLSIDGESRSDQEEWLRLLIRRFFEPNGYTLSGEVSWSGDESGDTGVIYVDRNRVEAVQDIIGNTGPSWNPTPPEHKWTALLRAGRNVVAHWERGDLAAQVRALDDALRPFAEVPVEECA